MEPGTLVSPGQKHGAPKAGPAGQSAFPANVLEKNTAVAGGLPEAGVVLLAELGSPFLGTLWVLEAKRIEAQIGG